ncbi:MULTISPECIES: 1,4-dihydroxy-6-naphthoate synthase [unclassified Fibrobacter]|jgi:1,4-dihydroxy-6-naphthoate synthase|uniref:1,4-dihydroxy-6-naphthoate synthase n=1 Tax=unclassified Fibrobacter TaxID=2634177 RepID=UPI001E4025D0|nr:MULTISPECIES: 1,4-dihydroxy-6-naphthoate synthase [unclassified Fibrobacter]
MMRLSLGISTCPNDTYIYEALVQGLEKSPFEWNVHFADVQTLNEMVRRGELDVAKVSAQVYPKIEAEYACLSCGGAIGYGCGPLLLSSVGNVFCPEKPVVLPGADTTAALLFKFWHKKTGLSEQKIEYALFDQVYRSLRSKEAVQGVVIHEHRFTWKRDGLYLLQDLGAFWEENTGTPIPLGIAVAKRSLGENVICKVEAEIRKSLEIARKRETLVTPFIDKLAQIDDPNVMEAHIRMFVNDFSEDIGNRGKASLESLWALVRGE